MAPISIPRCSTEPTAVNSPRAPKSSLRATPRPEPRPRLGAAASCLTLTITAAALQAALPARAAAPDLSLLPPASSQTVSFSTDIQPLLEKACLQCHGAVKPKAGYRLDNRESALRGGDQGAAILPGDSAKSPLIHYVARLVEDMEMPPTGKGTPLTPAEVSLLRAWIDQGANWSEASAEPQIAFTVTPAAQYIWVDGNAARFREHNWTREGIGGGASEFSVKYDIDPRTHVDMEGRAMVGPDDYRFQTRVRRDDLGWVRLAYREFSRFQDDTGGYYAPFDTPAPRWGEDFVLRHRRATAEFGLELPDWPKFRLAYDLILREGNEATLHWGSVTGNGGTRNIYPGKKHVDETTHLITFDVSYDWAGLLISDQAQFEWHEQDNRRTQYEITGPAFDFGTVVRDQQDYWRGANVLRLERSLRDWLYVSGGYLYSQLRDAGGFDVTSFTPSDPTAPPTLDMNSDDLTLRRRSHVLNANTMLGPWSDLHFYAGLQAEWTRQEGFAAGQTYGTPTAFDANVDRAATDETFGLRYAGIPLTVLFAETRFQQETYSHFEEGLADTTQSFLRDTDAEGDTKDYEAGFTVSPWRSVSFQAKARHRDRENDYDHLRDIDLLSANRGIGYPAFIRSRDTETDEIETRLVLQPLRWLKTTLKYSISSTDFTTTTEGWDEPDLFNPPAPYPGGTVTAGKYDAQTVSAGFVFTPWSRLLLSPTVGWTTSDSRSSANNGLESVPYRGDSWSLLTSATYILDEKTDLLASYLFNTADYAQDNEASGLPLGIEYTRHAMTVGIARRMKHERLVRLEYGFFEYSEPTLGGAADYTAHGLFASFRFPWK
jgi:hypothetical protein